MVSDRAFIFHMYIPWGKTLSFVSKSSHLSRSKSNIKVTVYGKKMAVVGAFVFHKNILLYPHKRSLGVILESASPSVRPGHNFKSIKASNFKLHTEIGHIVEKCTVQEP